MRVGRKRNIPRGGEAGDTSGMHLTEKRCVLRAVGCVSLLELGARRLSATVLLLAVVGCAPDIVTWEESRIINGPTPDSWLMLSGPVAIFVPTAVPAMEIAPVAAACAGSIRVARGQGKDVHAVWWSVRPDSSAALLASRSGDAGATWAQPVPVDTSDMGGLGCARLPPAIAVDAATGYIHVVYSLESASGSGVFFSHSMERGALYHAPVAIVYGDRPSSADVAANASRVMVAYEDPNLREQSPGKIALAISRTDGHIFEHRVPVTGGSSPVGNPRVAVVGDRVAVSWVESDRMINGTQRWKVRVGKVK